MKEVYENPDQWASAMANRCLSTTEAVCDGDIYARQRDSRIPFRARFTIEELEDYAKANGGD